MVCVEVSKKIMRIYEWVEFMIGIDISNNADNYDYLIIGVSGVILIIFVSAVFTLMLSIGGVITGKRL